MIIKLNAVRRIAASQESIFGEFSTVPVRLNKALGEPYKYDTSPLQPSMEWDTDWFCGSLFLNTKYEELNLKGYFYVGFEYQSKIELIVKGKTLAEFYHSLDEGISKVRRAVADYIEEAEDGAKDAKKNLPSLQKLYHLQASLSK